MSDEKFLAWAKRKGLELDCKGSERGHKFIAARDDSELFCEHCGYSFSRYSYQNGAKAAWNACKEAYNIKE